MPQIQALPVFHSAFAALQWACKNDVRVIVHPGLASHDEFYHSVSVGQDWGTKGWRNTQGYVCQQQNHFLLQWHKGTTGRMIYAEDMVLVRFANSKLGSDLWRHPNYIAPVVL